jgi:hypothetical protein
MNSTLKKRRHGNRQKETWRFENALFPKGLAFGEHGSSPASRTISTDNRCCKRAHQKWWVRFSLCKTRPFAALIPVFRRNTRLGLHHGPGSFVNLSDQPRRESVSRGFFRICRVPRVRRVIRVIRVIRVLIAEYRSFSIFPVDKSSATTYNIDT